MRIGTGKAATAHSAAAQTASLSAVPGGTDIVLCEERKPCKENLATDDLDGRPGFRIIRAHVIRRLNL